MHNLTARDVMTRDVEAVSADWTLHELRNFLVARSISGAPVTDKTGKIVGVVSSTDLMRAATEGSSTSTEAEEHELYMRSLSRRLSHEDMRGIHVEPDSTTTVRDVMTPAVFEVAPDASIHEVADMMARGRIHRVFVSRGGRIEGVVSALDIVTVLRNFTRPAKG